MTAETNLCLGKALGKNQKPGAKVTGRVRIYTDGDRVHIDTYGDDANYLEFAGIRYEARFSFYETTSTVCGPVTWDSYTIDRKWDWNKGYKRPEVTSTARGAIIDRLRDTAIDLFNDKKFLQAGKVSSMTNEVFRNQEKIEKLAAEIAKLEAANTNLTLEICKITDFA